MPVIVIILFLWLPVSGGYSPSVRNNVELDRLILRIAGRYSVALPRSFYSQPMHVSELMQFFATADSLDSAGVLTKQESLRLRNVKKIISGQRHIFKLNKPEWETENYINCALTGDIAPFYKDEGEIRLQGIINPSIRGVTGNISYFSEVSVWTEYRSDTVFSMSSYQPFDGNPYNLSGSGRVKTSSMRSSDIFRGGISYTGKRVDLETAVDYLRQGPAVYFPLTFSGEGSPVTYFRARMDLAAFQYVHSFGLLRTQKDKSKYFYTHRLDFPLFKDRVHIGVNEVIINGSTAEKAQTDSQKEEQYGEERTFEWVYMIPFVPYAFAEHYVGDRDNAVLSFDCDITFPRMFRWYIEFFLDDIDSPFTIFGDDFGNKWALTAGGQFFGTLVERDITVTFEYSRIEPWVYTHFYGGSHRYSHYGQSLGSAMGPNSDALILNSEYALGPCNSLGLYVKNTRKGTDRGSSITHVFQSDKSSNPDSETKEFLGKDYNRLTTGGIYWKFSPFGIFNVTTDLTFDSDNKVAFTALGGFYF